METTAMHQSRRQASGARDGRASVRWTRPTCDPIRRTVTGCAATLTNRSRRTIGLGKWRRPPAVKKAFRTVPSYPNEPVPSDHRLGEVETTSGCEEGFLDGSDAAERPMSLRLQTDVQRTRKARQILVEESRTEAPPPAPPPAPQQQHDESAMCPQTPEKLQENNGECEGDRHPSALIESAPDKDSCCTPSGDSSRGAGEPDLVTERRRLHLVISSHLEEVISVKVKAKVKYVRKKPSRPKVKRPPKVKVAKPPKVPKTFKRKSESSQTCNAKPRAEGAAGRKHDSLHGTAAAEVTPHPASGEALGPERQNESAPSSKPAEPAELHTSPLKPSTAPLQVLVLGTPERSALICQYWSHPATITWLGFFFDLGCVVLGC